MGFSPVVLKVPQNNRFEMSDYFCFNLSAC